MANQMLDQAVERYKLTAAAASRVDLATFVRKGQTLYIRAPRVVDAARGR